MDGKHGEYHTIHTVQICTFYNTHYHPATNSSLTEFMCVLTHSYLSFFSLQCKANYDAEWMRAPHRHCPNLVPIDKDWETRLRSRASGTTMFDTYAVDVKIHQTGLQYTDHYASLADMWTEWHRQYLNADFPRLLIRFEDFLFHREHVMAKIHECAGIHSSNDNNGSGRRPGDGEDDSNSIKLPPVVKYRLSEGKSHGRSSDLLTALTKYGASKGRYAGMATDDLQYAAKALDPQLLQLFHYPPVPTV
jgi:hypothetical protein